MQGMVIRSHAASTHTDTRYMLQTLQVKHRVIMHHDLDDHIIDGYSGMIVKNIGPLTLSKHDVKNDDSDQMLTAIFEREMS
jgi:hypothetical protein